MKKVLVLLMFFVSISCFALPINSQQTHPVNSMTNLSNCGHAAPISNPPAFCTSFKSIAYCHCAIEHGMPSVICNNMQRVYQIMLATHDGSLWNACSPKVQSDVPQQECVDDWNFYNSHCN